jgi:hypothetical protein
MIAASALSWSGGLGDSDRAARRNTAQENHAMPTKLNPLSMLLGAAVLCMGLPACGAAPVTQGDRQQEAGPSIIEWSVVDPPGVAITAPTLDGFIEEIEAAGLDPRSVSCDLSRANVPWDRVLNEMKEGRMHGLSITSVGIICLQRVEECTHVARARGCLADAGAGR